MPCVAVARPSPACVERAVGLGVAREGRSVHELGGAADDMPARVGLSYFLLHLPRRRACNGEIFAADANPSPIPIQIGVIGDDNIVHKRHTTG